MIPALLLAAAITFPAGPKTRIVVEVGAGDVRIRGEARHDILVDAERATATADGDRIVIRAADAATTPAREAPSRISLRLPPSTMIESIRIIDGSLIIEEFAGAVAADVRQGRISASRVSGVLRLETGFGDVVVDRASPAAGGLIRLRAFNGDVRLTLASYPANARVLAVTFNGTIETDLPLTRRESFGPKFAEGSFGAGEQIISLDSITGKIVINVASPRR